MIDVRISGIDTVIRKLESYRDGLEVKKRQLAERLAEIGINAAELKFSEAQYDGTNDVVVSHSPEWEGDTLKVIAEGTTVLFIEFGTGVHYSEAHPKAGELGFERGTYGAGKGSRNSWGYYGEAGTNGRFVRSSGKGDVFLTHGNPPARAMYDASTLMRQRIADIAKEVFS